MAEIERACSQAVLGGSVGIGWELTSNDEAMLAFHKTAERMNLSVGNGIAIFILTEDPAS